MQITGGEALARQLALEGVRHVFGVPGVQLDAAFDGLAQVADQIEFRGTRHEQAATYMADGYARTSGRIGVCMMAPGPGMLNALAGLATAYACSSPVLLITGQIPSATIGAGLGMLHEIPDQSGTLASLTKSSTLVTDPAEIPRAVRAACRELLTGRPRPVGLEIPPDVLERSADIELIEPAGDQGAARASADDVNRIAELIAASSRPVIVAGSGVLRGDGPDRLRALAERIGAPVVMSPNGRGALSDRHPLALTDLSGRTVVPAGDLVIGVGTRFIAPTGAPLPLGDRARLVLVNADPADLGAPRRPDVAVCADAALTLQQLGEAMGEGRPFDEPGLHAELDAVRAAADAQIEAIQPQAAWLAALRSAMPDDGIFVTELTQVGYLAEVGFPVYGAGTFVTPGYQGTLGYGYPTALGAKVANPDRMVVSISGDGGFGWNLQELATARRYDIGVISVVFNDGHFGNVRRMQQQKFGREIGTDLVNPDFVALGTAFGIPSSRVDGPEQLRDLIVASHGRGGPTLIEVPVGEMPSPWHLIRAHLAKR